MFRALIFVSLLLAVFESVSAQDGISARVAMMKHAEDMLVVAGLAEMGPEFNNDCGLSLTLQSKEVGGSEDEDDLRYSSELGSAAGFFYRAQSMAIIDSRNIEPNPWKFTPYQNLVSGLVGDTEAFWSSVNSRVTDCSRIFDAEILEANEYLLSVFDRSADEDD